MKKLGILLVSLYLLTGCNDPMEPTQKEQQPTKTAKQEAGKQAIPEIHKAVRADQAVELPYPSYSETRWVKGTLYAGVVGPSGTIDQVVAIPSSGQEPELIFESEYEQPSIHTVLANEDWLVFVDAESTGQKSKIYAVDLKTKKQKQIFTYNPEHEVLILPALDGHYAAWAEPDEKGQKQVVLYDLSTDQKTVLDHFNDFHLYNNFLAMGEGRVLWTDSKDGTGYFKVHDIAEGKTRTFEAPQPYPGYAQLVGNKVFSLNFSDHATWSAQEFGMFDIETETYEKIEIDTPYLNQLTSDGKNNIAVLDAAQQLIGYRIMKDGSLQKVAYELPEGEAIEKLSFSGGKLLIGLQQEEYKTSKLLVSDMME